MAATHALHDNAWWQQRTGRERTVLAVGTALLAVILVFTWALVPMLDTIAQAPALRAERQQRLTEATAQVAALQAPVAAPVAHGDARTAAERALRERNLLGNGGTVDLQDGRVVVTLPAVALADLLPALASLDRSDGLRAVAATLTPRADAGVRAELTLAR